MRHAPALLLFLAACNAPPELVAVGKAPAPEGCDPLSDAAASDGAVALSKPALPPGARYAVLPGVTLSPHVASRLVQLDDEFARRTGGGHLTVVSGTRDAARQARAMHQVLLHGGNILTLYEDKAAAAEIKRAHDRAVAAGKPEGEVVSAVQRVIQAQIDHGVFISAHLRAGAADVRSTSMSAAERRAFKAVAQEAPGVRLLEESSPPHFHLQID